MLSSGKDPNLVVPLNDDRSDIAFDELYDATLTRETPVLSLILKARLRIEFKPLLLDALYRKVE
jgi:hypothetical protein